MVSGDAAGRRAVQKGSGAELRGDDAGGMVEVEADAAGREVEADAAGRRAARCGLFSDSGNNELDSRLCQGIAVSDLLLIIGEKL